MSNLDGQTLGKYQMIERLGRGGMADVYKAYQPGLDRYVAIKVLHPHLSEDKDFITRFQREAKSVAKLRHPNIMQVYDFDSQGDQFFMVMEFVEGGQSLKEYLQALNQRGERIPLAASAELTARLADALDYAHKEGMVHRDIKPANVLLPSLDKPLLGDFGIARIVGQTGLTAEGAMIGTPAYMSPEQGRGERADERSDIYALGIILYELITNQPPYDADTPYGVILKHMNDPLISPREFVADVPNSLERVVLKSLAKDPADRYASAGEMRDALNKTLEELKSATQPSSSTTPLKASGKGATQVAPAHAGETQYASGKQPRDEAMTQQVAAPAGKAARRSGLPKWVWAIVGIVVLALVGGGLFATGLLGGLAIGSGGPGEPMVAGQPPSGQTFAALSADDQENANEGYKLIMTWDPDESYVIFQALAAEYPDNPDLKAAMATALMQDSRNDEALAILNPLEASGADTQMTNLALGLSYNWRENGSLEKALSYMARAIEQCPNNVHLCIYSLRERTWMHWYGNRDFDSAHADISRAIDLSPEPLIRSSSLDIRSDLFEMHGDFDEAMTDLEEAFELEDSQSPWILEEAAGLAAIAGEFDRAEGYYETMRALDPDSASYMAGQGYVKFRLGDVAKATELANLAIEFDPALNQPHYLLALMAQEAGDYDGALAEFQKILDSDNPGDYQYPFYDTENGHQITFDRAQATLAKGDVDGALALIDQTLQEDQWWPHPYVVRAAIYKNRGEVERARIELSQAMDIAKDWNRQDIIDWIQGFIDDLD